MTNLQGDVIGLLDSSGSFAASYTYDAWGNPLSSTGTQAGTIGALNPLRYRGYIYDAETGFYYLQSRYYDPQTGRFINADSYASTGQGIMGNNMFAYCNDNPVNGCDPCGSCFHRWDFWNDCQNCKQVDYCAIPGVSVSNGYYLSLNLGIFNVSGTFELAVDSDFNIQFYNNISFDITTSGGLSGSFGTTTSIFAIPDTSYLAGDSYYIGGSVGVPIPETPIAVSGSTNIAKTSDGYWGVVTSTGITPARAAGSEFHAGYSHGSALTPQINIFDLVGKLYDSLFN